MIISGKYLRLPVSRGASKSKMLFLENGKLIFDLRVLLDNKKPDGYYYYDVTRFAGRDISFIVNGAEYDPEIVDFCLEGTGDEPLRPRMHFTAKRGWINDPNGLVYSSGVYHMFYQHNPVGYLWDNMHWSHAISRDLVNWKRLGCALYPDEMGTMYSGSGIVDERNVTGLAVGDAKTICLFYTAFGNAADGGNAELSKNKNSCQCLAYSVDGGKTFTKYERNPLISGYSKEARDPKVIWVEELGAYVLALYLERHDFMLFSSTDLLTWEEYQRISIPSDSECPDFYPLTADDGKRKWVFSGASDYYLIGDLTQSGFISTQGEKRMCRGNGRYASQTYSGTIRRIKTGWGTTPAPGQIFNNQMSCFTEVTLRKINDEYFLCEYPVEEYGKSEKILLNCAFSGVKRICGFGLDISINGITKAQVMVGETEIDIDVDQRHLSVCGELFVLPVGAGDMRILVDTLGFELFADGGLVYLSYRGTGNRVTEIFTDTNVELMVGSVSAKIE